MNLHPESGSCNVPSVPPGHLSIFPVLAASFFSCLAHLARFSSGRGISRLSLIAVLVVAAGAVDAGENGLPKGNLVRNGDFSRAMADGKVAGWRTHGAAGVVEIDGNPCLRIARPGAIASVRIRLNPNWARLRLTMRMRVKDVVAGDQSWKDARLAMCFVDAGGRRVGNWPNVFHAVGTSGWVRCEREYTIPLGAEALKLDAANFGKTGAVFFDDICLRVTLVLSSELSDLPRPETLPGLWSMKGAWQRSSATRGRICLNDLWRFRPVLAGETPVSPAGVKAWGWAKVPHTWRNTTHWNTDPPVTDEQVPPYVAQRIKWKQLEQAWYKRTFAVPAEWSGRWIGIEFTMLQTHALVFVDNCRVGEVWFPGGELELSSVIKPGHEQTLAILVTGRPLAKEKKVFMAPGRVFKDKVKVNLKGITGDLYLCSRPARVHLGDTQIRTSTRRNEITFSTALRLDAQQACSLAVVIREEGRTVKTFASPVFGAAQIRNGRYLFTAPWKDARRWDLHTPGNMYQAVISLKDEAGNLLDRSLPINFGFREFWIQGRDFYLNGTPIHLRALNVANPGLREDKACVAGCLATCDRLQEQGFNALIWGNYAFTPGQVGYIDGLLRASDMKGVLNAFTLPHAKDFQWRLDCREQRARYRALTAWLIRRVQNHPSVVLYAMTHNACGYYGDQNPLKIDGRYAPTGKSRNRSQALIAAGIANDLDPTRPVYHHQSGNLGAMHTINTYLNWAPIQERNDWLEHWAATGAKPVFFVEWGLPHISSWSSYRGPHFIWRTPAFQSIWDSEFAAALLGQDAYAMTPGKQQALILEESLYAKGEPFAWAYLISRWRKTRGTYLGIQARFAAENWRALRTWGLSAGLPWDKGGFFERRSGLTAKPNPDAMKNLQQPGIVPDRINPGRQYIYHRDPGDFTPTPIGRAMLRWNQPVIAYIGGGPRRFTERSHNLFAGEMLTKQLVLVNDSRVRVACRVSWKLEGTDLAGLLKVSAAPGMVGFTPLQVKIPKNLRPGKYLLSATFALAGGGQTDSMAINIIQPLRPMALESRVGLFDPAGRSGALLRSLGIRFDLLGDGNDGSGCDIIVIGREAITMTGQLPAILAASGKRRILVLEQKSDVLEKRLGFRVQEHCMRKVFARAPMHPILADLGDDVLHDWRGSGTLLPPYLTGLPHDESDNPKWYWCGFENTRVWRCGNVGAVASVLIEKPVRGNWTPLLDCGFDLQYSPLLEYGTGAGRIIFCQLDVSGRTAMDPAALKLMRQVFAYLDRPAARSFRPVLALGRVDSLLKKLGFSFTPFTPDADPGSILVVGPGKATATQATAWRNRGGRVLALGLDAQAAGELAGGRVKVRATRGWARLIRNLRQPLLAGISNAELHWRTRLAFAALRNRGDDCNEALQIFDRGELVMCQVAPWMFDAGARPYLRTTERRVCALVAQLLRNLGAGSTSPLVDRLSRPGKINVIALPTVWRGKVDRDRKGRAAGWFKPHWQDRDWETLTVPGNFDEQSREINVDYQGYYWYRVRFSMPVAVDRGDLKLYLGAIDDESWVWLNGRFLGEVTKKTNPKDYYCAPREYALDPGWLNWGGENVLAVLVNDTYLSGGIKGKPCIRAGRGAWLDSYYVQEPRAGDDPYRYYRW